VAAKDEVIEVKALSSTSSPERTADTRTMAETTASSAIEWVQGEAGWLAAMFARMAVSVAFFRVLGLIFGGGYASRRAYDQAGDLATFGRRPRSYRPAGSGGGGSYSGGGSSEPNGNGPSGGGRNGGAQLRHSEAPPFDPGANGEKARFVAQVEEHKLWHHGSRLNPEHYWPCPITEYRSTPCASCFWRVEQNDVDYCTAIEKLKALLRGIDDGSTLYELRTWIKES
jgi:hypothetical protein